MFILRLSSVIHYPSSVIPHPQALRAASELVSGNRWTESTTEDRSNGPDGPDGSDGSDGTNNESENGPNGPGGANQLLERFYYTSRSHDASPTPTPATRNKGPRSHLFHKMVERASLSLPQSRPRSPSSPDTEPDAEPDATPDATPDAERRSKVRGNPLIRTRPPGRPPTHLLGAAHHPPSIYPN